MKMTRDFRNKIEQTLLTHRFGEQQKALNQRSNELFAETVEALWGDLWPTIKKIPAGKLFGQTHLHTGNFNIRGDYPLPIPQDCRDDKTINDVLKSTKLGVKLKKYIADYDKYLMARNAARTAIRTMLETVNTEGQLFKQWPELKTVIAPPVKVKTKALAVNLKPLNKMLGLPAKVA